VASPADAERVLGAARPPLSQQLVYAVEDLAVAGGQARVLALVLLP
jgi:hypothetical protein